jgi:hypothetical protein
LGTRLKKLAAISAILSYVDDRPELLEYKEVYNVMLATSLRSSTRQN